ncbi:hypothetical protein O181_100378 [Austropuccinia psidii MF-1]|uniref:Chromo domain-containing protein n=1 Tax=Austropuccinia psidii MF-1 TaxID=1389203 RepID=A0A9Q3JCM4_9BASI|nr:hypothetical protein [Austropuccinia psidii MF-1]
MDWVTALPPSGDKIYDACLVIFPLRNPAPLTVPPVEWSEEKMIRKVIKERRLRGKNQREYLVRYRNPVHKDEWLAESEIPDSDQLLRRFRHERRPQA